MAKSARYHVLVCHDTDREGCAGAKAMRKAWKRLEQAVDDAALSDDVVCTRTECFGICEDGPIAVVYPDAVWYGGLDGKSIERLVEGHLRDGREVGDLVIEGPTGPPRRERR